MERQQKRSVLAAWISLLSNILLTGIKIITGLLFNSQVLIADGAHNAGDVIASAAALSAMRISKQPPDDDHPYGHGKAEVIGAGIVAVILVIAAVFIAYNAVEVLIHPMHDAHLMALIAAVISLVWKQALYVYTIRIAVKVNSKGLIATAHDHLADVYASIAAVVGIGLGLIGQHYGLPALAYADPLAGLIVALLVLKLAYHMGKESIGVLMEEMVDAEKIKAYNQLAASIPGVKRIDRIRARDHGHYIIIDVRVAVDGNLTVQQGHDISREIKRVVMEGHPEVGEVLIHLNPWYK